MKKLIQLEEIALFISTYVLSILIGFDWWVFIVLLFFPDLSMLGYFINNKIGAWIYNIFHFRFLAIAIALLGYYTSNDIVILIGLVLFGHSTMDRIFGYGLKYKDHFKNTHLGWIGEKNEQKG